MRMKALLPCPLPEGPEYVNCNHKGDNEAKREGNVLELILKYRHSCFLINVEIL
jgi:hypothetical protein